MRALRALGWGVVLALLLHLAVMVYLTARAEAENATSYCLQGTMADGTWVRPGSLAHNGYALGTKVTVSPPVFGLTQWVVRDRIGHSSQADFWTGSCAAAIQFGRRYVRITPGWTVKVKRGKVRRKVRRGLGVLKIRKVIPA